MRCGLCEQDVTDWEAHETGHYHKLKEKSFFANEGESIEHIFNSQHLHSKTSAQMIFLILKGDYEERLKHAK